MKYVLKSTPVFEVLSTLGPALSKFRVLQTAYGCYVRQLYWNHLNGRWSEMTTLQPTTLEEAEKRMYQEYTDALFRWQNLPLHV